MSVDIGLLCPYLLGRIACTECEDAACCYRCFVVCLLDITMSCAKTDEAIEMPFVMRVEWVKEPCIRRGDAQGKGHFGARGAPCDAVSDHFFILL